MAVNRIRSNLQRGFKLCLLTLCFILIFSALAYAQGIVNLTIHDEVYAFIKRLTAKNLIGQRLDTTQPLTRREIAKALIEVTEGCLAGRIRLTDVEKKHLEIYQWLWGEEIGLLKPELLIPTARNHTIAIKSENHYIVFDFKVKQENASVRSYAQERRNSSITSTEVKMLGRLGPNIGISSTLHMRALLGSDIYNPYREENNWNMKPVITSGMTSMEGYIVLDQPWISAQWGLNKAWWGPGWRGALILSDNSAPMDNIKLSSSYGPLKYTYFMAILRESMFKEYHPKYISAHRIEFLPYRGINIGLSEVVVFADRLEVRYLNPLISFQSMQAEDNKNNGLIGMDFDVTLIPSIEFYGELMVDDIQLQKGKKLLRTWGSKYGILAGGYWVDPIGLKDSDIRAEYAFVNQYAYTHRYNAINYTHQGSVIGHWMGTDADNLWLKIGHWFTDKLHVSMTYERERHGEGDVNSPGKDADLSKYWEFLSGVTELTHSFSARLLYSSIGRYSTSIEYTYSQHRNVGHERSADGEGHQLVISTEYRF